MLYDKTCFMLMLPGCKKSWNLMSLLTLGTDRTVVAVSV